MTEIPPKITSGFGTIKFDGANFTVPSQLKNYTYELKFNGNGIFSEKIFVTEVPTVRNLLPRSVALAFPTKFTADVKNLTANVTKYEWDFDGDKKITVTNEIVYSFKEMGTHNVTIKITDAKQRVSSSFFQIEVLTPRNKINQSIDIIKYSIERVKLTFNSLPSFYQESLNNVIDIESAEKALAEVQKNYSVATTDEEYIKIVEKILEIKIPDSVRISKSASSILFFPDQEKVNFEVLETIGAGTPKEGLEDEYANAVAFWSQENLDSRITYTEISAAYEGIEKPILNIFELSVREKVLLSLDPYLVIKNMANLEFSVDYGQKESLGYYYIILKPGSDRILFSTTEEVDFVTLDAFISPALGEIEVSELNIDLTEAESRWGLFFLILAFLGFFFIVIYSIMQQWYKYKYETHLFKNRNNLFNLVTFINNQKREGVPEKEIMKKLKKVKWTSEQVDYAMKRYVGKRTGMLELIPFDKIFGRKKKEDQKIPSTGNYPSRPLGGNQFGP